MLNLYVEYRRFIVLGALQGHRYPLKPYRSLVERFALSIPQLCILNKLQYFADWRKFEFTLNLLNPTGHVMHHQFNIQQLYVLPTLYLCVLYLSENKQRLVPLTA